VDITKYHQAMCNGKNMCSDTTADHRMSVEDIIADIVATSTTSVPKAVATSTTSVPKAVDAEKAEKLVRFDDIAVEPKKSTKRTTVRKVKMTVKPIESKVASSTAHDVEDDDIDETAHMFQMKEDGRKPRKRVKGGRSQKVRVKHPK
jgi:hypothetical protein